MTADYTVTAYTRRITARVTSNRMTVGQVIYFADLLRENNVPLREQVTYHRSDEGHFTGMSASYSEELPDNRADVEALAAQRNEAAS